MRFLDPQPAPAKGGDVKNVTYEVIDVPAAIGMGAPRSGQYDPKRNNDDDYRKVIYRCEDGVPVEWIGDDGGEPEDQTLGRDWKWVAPALRVAYKLGREAVV